MTRKRSILVGVVGGLIALVALLTTLWFSVWSPPTKQDFKTAAANAAELRKSYESISTSSVAYTQKAVATLRTGGKDGDILSATKNEAKDYDSAVAIHDAWIEKLESSPVLRDKEAKKIYQQVAERDRIYVAYADSLVASYPLFYKTFLTCNNIYSFERSNDNAKNAASHKAAADDCLKDVDVLSKSKHAALAKYGKQLGEIVRGRQTALDQVAKDSATAKKSLAKIAELSAKAKALDPITDIQKAREDARDNGSLKRFEDFVKNKEKNA